MKIELVRLVHNTVSGYAWYLIDRRSSHVFAQGHTKHYKRAQTQANETAVALSDDLGLEVVLSDAIS